MKALIIHLGYNNQSVRIFKIVDIVTLFVWDSKQINTTFQY